MNQELNLDELLLKVQKPARYLGTEVNSIHKRSQDVDVQLALAFPDIYEVAMSHLGLKILYGAANRIDSVQAQRVFAPAEDMEAVLREKGLPLFSLEGRRPFNQFDLVGFTLQYELSYTSILNMLQLGQVPLYSQDRTTRDPFILGGGPCAFNPEPLAPFFDAFVIGDGEEVLEEIIVLYRRWKQEGTGDRQAFLRDLSQLPGLYIPSFYQPVYSGDTFTGLEKMEPAAPDRITKRTVRDLDHTYYPDDFIVPFIDVVHDRASLELFRGCSRGCRFCQAGMIYRPVRERSLQNLTCLAERIIQNTGFEEISLASLSSSDYSAITPLVQQLEERLGKKIIRLSLPSLRANRFSVQLSDRLQKGKAAGVTFAPEAGSQRLRKAINKQISEQEIMEAAGEAIASGRNHIKLYFMLGLPTEGEEDLKEIGRLAGEILDLRRQGKGRGMSFKVSVSVSTFVPKAHSPFQWEPQLPLAEVKNRQEYLRRIFKKIKGAELNWHGAEMSFLEAVFARGDRRLAPVLEKALAGGARMDAWDDRFDFSLWMEAFQAESLDPARYTAFRPGYAQPLPWDHISPGVSRDFLIREHQRALQGQETPDCRREGCWGCGLPYCPTRQVKQDAPL